MARITRNKKPAARVMARAGRDDLRKVVQGLLTLQQNIGRRASRNLSAREVRMAIREGRL